MKPKIDFYKPNVVAVVSSEADLAQAIEFKKTDADFVEIRVDAGLGRLTPWLPKIKLPIIITVRDKSEGGLESLAPWQRAHLFLEYLPFASFIDIEIQQIHNPEFKQVIQEARKRGVGIIGSYHDFKGVPPEKTLAQLLRIALKYKCAVIKIALTLENLWQLSPVSQLNYFIVKTRIKIPLSIMSMGKLGKKTRPLFANLGSTLNYGYITEPSATGQWQAQALKKRIERF